MSIIKIVKCPSVRLSRRSTAAAAAGGFAAEVGRRYRSIAAAASRLAGRVNFGSTVRRSNILVLICLVNSKIPTESCWRVKGSPYSIIERRVPELIPVLGSQPAGDMNHKLGRRLPLLSARPAVTPATLKRVAINFAAWWTEAQMHSGCEQFA